MTDLRTPPLHDGGLFPERVRQHAYEKPLQPLRILEAGCGGATELDHGCIECTVTGVDVDLPELRARTQGRGDLDAWHLGDLRTVPMPPRVYDIVHAWHLIERISHAELVLDRFVAALKPGGLMLLRFRDRGCAFGYLDRMLPRLLIHWSRRLLWGGEPAPRAVYERVASLEGMRWYCMMRGLVVTEEYTSRDTVLAAGRVTSGLCSAVSRLTGNRLTSAYSEVTMVIRKPENRFARVI